MIWTNNDIDVDVTHEVFVHCMPCCSWILLKTHDAFNVILRCKMNNVDLSNTC